MIRFDEQIDALQTWLNPKGTRELGLKNAIAKWRGYILAGARKRLAVSRARAALNKVLTLLAVLQETSGSSTAPVTFNDGRRGSSRKKDEPDQVGNQYRECRFFLSSGPRVHKWLMRTVAFVIGGQCSVLAEQTRQILMTALVDLVYVIFILELSHALWHHELLQL